MWRVRLPFSVNVLAEQAAVAALEDDIFREITQRVVAEGRTVLSDGLRALGCTVLPSHANFLMFAPPVGGPDARVLHQTLLERGIIVRALGGYHLPDWLPGQRGHGRRKSAVFGRVRGYSAGRPGMSPEIRDVPSVITLDGPAGVGKSTTARRLAAALGVPYLDTGAMYRTLGLRLGAAAADMSDEELRRRCAEYSFSLEPCPTDRDSLCLFCNGQPVGDEIRTEKAGRLASLVARLPVLREALQNVQRSLGRRWSLVAEGRDMGTRVFPEARYKFFLDARPEVRAERRCRELAESGRDGG